jgi:hypothetical protein
MSRAPQPQQRIDVPQIRTSQIYVNGAELTATSAELNLLDGVTGPVIANGTAGGTVTILANDANGEAIATAVNAILARLVAFQMIAGTAAP